MARVFSAFDETPSRQCRWPVFRNTFSRTVTTFNVADRLTLAYLIFSTALIIVCRQNVQRWTTLLPIHLGLIVIIFGLAYARKRAVPVLSLLSHWYPTLLFLFFFEEIGLIVHAIFPGWFDGYLIKADYAMFGVHPTVWIEQFSNYWLTEYMQLVYTSYFLMTIGLGSYLWIRDQREDFAVFIASTCATYYLCYVIFVLFPIESPHHTLRHLQQVELAGGPFTEFINLIEKHGRVHGGAFPSAHVAGTVVVLISAWRFARRASYWLTPLALSICVATVYGRYHYVMDVFAGILMAVIGCWLGGKLCSVKTERVENTITFDYKDVKKARKGYGGKNSFVRKRVNPRSSLIAGIAVIGGLLGLAFWAASQTK